MFRGLFSVLFLVLLFLPWFGIKSLVVLVLVVGPLVPFVLVFGLVVY